MNIQVNANFKDKSTKKITENEEVLILKNKDEIAQTDQLNNSRKKRRRSSASVG